MHKRYLINILALLLLNISCNDWLDVRSEEQVLEEEAFSTYQGFRMALIGVYNVMSQEELWGRELTWGFMSVVSRNYNETYLPNRYLSIIQDEHFEADITKSIIAGFWETGYNAIANCNNILKNIEDKPGSFFSFDWEKELIIAEARGLRAVMHFELLRLFVAAPSSGYSGRAIPYVTDYPNFKPEYLNIDDVLVKIIEDLEYAHEKLKEIDVEMITNRGTTTFSNYFFYGMSNFLENGTYGTANGFFSLRGSRINYWGVTALLARVYSYMGDNETAVEYVDEILTDEWYFTGGFQFNSSSGTDGKRLPEPIVCFWNTKNTDNYEKFINESGKQYAMRMLPLKELFGSERGEDTRYVGLYDTVTSYYQTWEKNNSSGNTEKYSDPLLPVLDFSELFYIKSQYQASLGDIDAALATLREVKRGRDISTAPVAYNYNDFMELLVNDATRDHLTRGQTWHFLKKLNWKKMYNGTSVTWDVPDSWFVLPMPESETSYY